MTPHKAITKKLIVALVSAVLGVIVAFGLPITADQQTGILALTGVLCSLIAASDIFGDRFIDEDPDADNPS